MGILSLFSIKFGLILFLCTSLHSAIYAWLCSIFKVRILRFALFSDPWKKTLFNIKIGNIEYVHGWLPGLNIQPLIISEKEGEYNQLLPGEENFAMNNKPLLIRSIFKIIPYVVWLGSAH